MCVTSGSSVSVPELPGSSILVQFSACSHSEPPGPSLLELEEELELADSLLELEEEHAGKFCGLFPCPLKQDSSLDELEDSLLLDPSLELEDSSLELEDSSLDELDSSLLLLDSSLELEDSSLDELDSSLLDEEQSGKFCGFSPWPA